MAAYYLQMQPHLFQEAVRTAFQRIKEAREEDAAAAREKEDAAKQVGGPRGRVARRGMLWAEWGGQKGGRVAAPVHQSCRVFPSPPLQRTSPPQPLPATPPPPTHTLPTSISRVQAAEAGQGGTAGADLVLYRRMAEVKRLEQLVAIEDLMYICILEKFQVGGVLRFFRSFHFNLVIHASAW
jgi:hypothetical protein